MPHEIMMPQLGMAQDTGTIVAWHKAVGDPVKADDVLFEVETDKTTMEVPAGENGFVVDIRAAAGADVPVGDIIAMIGESADAVVSAPSAKPAADTPVAQEKSVPAPVEPSAAPSVEKPVPAPTDGRILASPKARWEAHRRGIPLADLARQGIPQPFHVADLDRWSPAPVAAAQRANPASFLQARVESVNFVSLRDWARDETEGVVGGNSIWASFACGAWRQAMGLEHAACVTVEVAEATPGGTRFSIANADRGGLRSIAALEETPEPDFLVRDLTGTSLCAYRPGSSDGAPVLVISRLDEAALELTLHFDECHLPFTIAATLLEALVARVRAPLKHLL
ncbi:MAG: biotin/lipoyl-containing protein [Geminicoccaceae bacterium]